VQACKKLVNVDLARIFAARARITTTESVISNSPNGFSADRTWIKSLAKPVSNRSIDGQFLRQRKCAAVIIRLGNMFDQYLIPARVGDQRLDAILQDIPIACVRSPSLENDDWIVPVDFFKKTDVRTSLTLGKSQFAQQCHGADGLAGILGRRAR
jgi:hypothetical protein